MNVDMSGSVSFDLNYMDLLSGDFFNENISEMVGENQRFGIRITEVPPTRVTAT